VIKDLKNLSKLGLAFNSYKQIIDNEIINSATNLKNCQNLVKLSLGFFKLSDDYEQRFRNHVKTCQKFNFLIRTLIKLPVL